MTDDYLDLQYQIFLVHERPICVWGADILADARVFLENLDPAYFEHVANTFIEQIDNERPHDKTTQYAALALRSTYSQALETLFALLCALLQAPQCPHGWVDNYKTAELFTLARKVHNRENVLTAITNPSADWPTLAEMVFESCILEDKEKQERIKRNFGQLWSLLAGQFLDTEFSEEYNAVKHGLRVRLGGFFIRIASQDSAKESPRNFQVLGASDFGTSFLTSDRIGDLRDHLQSKRYSHNWNPKDFAWGLHLVSISLANIICALKILNGVPATDVNFNWPTEDEVFEQPGKRTRQIGVTRMKGGVVQIEPEWV